LAADASGFYVSHKAEFDLLYPRGRSFTSDLGWLELNAPATRRLVLHPIYVTIFLEAVHGVWAADIAFIVGRTLYLLAKKESPVSWADVLKAAATATAVVAFLHSPKLLLLGFERLAERIRSSMLRAIGGSTDPQQVLAELRRLVAPDLSEDDACDLLLELTTDPVAGQVKGLEDSAVAMAPSIAAIVADVQRTGVATSATVAAALALSYPLFPTPP
jgi:hypothetical protein